MGERRGMKALELWCRRITKGYPGVRITNMTTSWRNGLGFCAIIHHFRPDLIDFDALRPEDVYKNNALAFETAETSLSVPALLDPQDMVDYEIPDRLSILTYVSQFYQAFVGQQGVPRPSAVDTEPQPSPEPTSPAAEKHVATSVRQREPCSVCELPVFLAERQLIERRLVHRTCFKCARCGSQLSTANYYITEDGQFCCEVCPDEEIGGRVEKTAAVLAHERAVLAGPAQDPLSEDADAVLELEPPADAARGAGVGADSSDSDTDSDSDGSESSGSEEPAVAGTREAGVAINGDGHGDGGVCGVGGETGVGGEVSSEKSAQEQTRSAADTADDDVSDAAATAGETETEAEPKAETGAAGGAVESTQPDSERPTTTPRSVTADSESSGPAESASAGDDAAGRRISLVQQRLQQFKAAERPQPAPRRAGRASQPTAAATAEEGEGEGSPVADRTPPDEAARVQGTEEAADAGAEKQDLSVKEAPAAESVNPFGDKEDEEEGSNPFGEPDEEPGPEVSRGADAEMPSAKPSEEPGVDSAELPSEELPKGPSVEPAAEPSVNTSEVNSTECPGVPSVEVTEPTPTKPPVVKEYNPFDEDDDEEEAEQADSQPAPAAGEKAEAEPDAKPTEEEEYPDDLNPFGDDEEEATPAATAAAPTQPTKPPTASLNPFGDTDDEEEEDVVTPTSSAQTSPSKPASSREINPFEKPPRPPPPTLDRRMLAARTAGTPPRPPEPPGLVREQRAGSLTSLSSSGKKKRPAPRPPTAHSSPSHSQGVSPAHSPSTLRKRHAPPPPPPAPPSTGPPAPDAGPESLSPERSKAEKEQVNYTKQVNNLTNKSIQGKYKRRKGPAPLRPKPIKRQVKTLPPKETQTELHDINVKQLELERQGVELEKTIRQLTEQDDKQQKELDSTAPYGLDIEDMILQLFELVNEKNALFRRQAELMYMRRQHRLEEEHAELEYEIRCLMMKADSLKTEAERQREQRLINRLVSVVEQRNEIVTMLEMERIREIQEDATIDRHMAERVGSAEPTPEKKKKKKKKKEKEKKEKEGSSKKKKKGQDDDKDIDEKEQATEKKKSKKIKLKKLFS